MLYTIETYVNSWSTISCFVNICVSEKCVIQSVDERATLQTTTLKAGSMLSYKEELKYTCSNKDKDIFNVQCAGAGNLYDISCPSKMILFHWFNHFKQSNPNPNLMAKFDNLIGSGFLKKFT